MRICDLSIWKEFYIGGKSIQEYQKNIYSHNIVTLCYAKEFLQKIFPCDRQLIRLVKVTPEILGETGNATTGITFEKAADLGLLLCNPATAYEPEYSNEPKGKWKILAMEPILDNKCQQRLLFSAGGWLNATQGHPSCLFNKDDEFVFRLP